MKTKPDEENFDEAAAQAYRAWTETTVPADTAALLRAPALAALTPAAPVFQHLLSALRQFALQPPHVLPLAAALPDMKADTAGYVRLQRLYKARAEHERAVFRGLVQIPVDDALVERFVRNAHALRALRGRRWGEFDQDPVALGSCPLHLARARGR